MFHLKTSTRQSGFTYVEAIIVSAVSVIIFGGLIVAFQTALQLNYATRASLSAQSLANERMEFFRSLPYDDVGVLSGFPAGAIPQNSTFTMNGYEISERVRVDYVDDPADGAGVSDGNGIEEDYKRVRVEYNWSINGRSYDLALVSTIVPRSIETDVGGGTMRIRVLDADVSLLEDASVRVLSSSSTFSYDVTNQTDANGEALFSVPADSGYQVFVSGVIGGRQYSTSSTYVPTSSNPIPTVAPLPVNESGISTWTFQIGELSDLQLKSYSQIDEGSGLEDFSSGTLIATSTNVATTSGELRLQNTAGVYDGNGMAYIGPFTPAALINWEKVRIAHTIPSNTSYRWQLFYASSTGLALIPDTDMPGNSTGFSESLFDISRVPSSYSSTTIGITLETTDTTVTPAIQEVAVYWREGETRRSGFDFYMTGAKVIGSELDSTPILKTTATVTTDGVGETLLSDLEYDVYSFTPDVPTVRLARACPAHPFTHEAGVNGELELVHTTSGTHSVRVAVSDGAGGMVPGVQVELAGDGYTETITTDSCGQVFFSDVPEYNEYELTTDVAGYNAEIVDPVAVSGEIFQSITLTES